MLCVECLKKTTQRILSNKYHLLINTVLSCRLACCMHSLTHSLAHLWVREMYVRRPNSRNPTPIKRSSHVFVRWSNHGRRHSPSILIRIGRHGTKCTQAGGGLHDTGVATQSNAAAKPPCTRSTSLKQQQTRCNSYTAERQLSVSVSKLVRQTSAV